MRTTLRIEYTTLLINMWNQIPIADRSAMVHDPDGELFKTICVAFAAAMNARRITCDADTLEEFFGDMMTDDESMNEDYTFIPFSHETSDGRLEH